MYKNQYVEERHGQVKVLPDQIHNIFEAKVM